MVERAAGFWRRFAASLIDAIVVGIVSYLLGALLGTVGQLVGLLVSLAYFTYFHGKTGRTPGDAALGIRVVDLRSGTDAPIGYGRAALRWLVSIASGIVVVLGYLWMLWDPQRQTWHDKAVGSLPIHEGTAPARADASIDDDWADRVVG